MRTVLWLIGGKENFGTQRHSFKKHIVNKELDMLSEGFYKYQGLNSGLSLGLAKKQVVFLRSVLSVCLVACWCFM